MNISGDQTQNTDLAIKTCPVWKERGDQHEPGTEA